MKLRDKIIRFMAGRNGNDQFNMVIFGIYTILLIVSLFLNKVPLAKYIILAIALLFIVLFFYRIFSRNLYRRRKENAIFMGIVEKIAKFFRLIKARWTYRKTHVFVSCPKCRETLRLPKGKGKISVKCPKCGNRFEKKV